MLKVTYKVEATRVEQRTDFDKPGHRRGDQAGHDPVGRGRLGGQDAGRACSAWRTSLNVNAEGIDIGPSPADEMVAERLSTPIEAGPRCGRSTASSARASTGG